MRASTLWLVLPMFGCADPATIGALCPPGCEPRPADSICDCSPPPEKSDAGTCAGSGCVEDAAVGGGSECAPQLLSRKRLDLMTVLNHGASISPWWPAMREGFKLFIEEEASRGTGLGLQYFGAACEAQAYSPPRFPIEPLPSRIAAIGDTLTEANLSTNSTLPAFQAAEQYAQRWATDHPESRVAVVLITDASPGACDALTGNYDVEAARIARAVHLSSPSIKTYVVGVGSLEVVKNIALAGGTEALLMPITAAPIDVTMALRTIRGTAGSCELALPRGATLGPEATVIVTGSNGSQQTFSIAADRAACDQADFYRSDDDAAFPLSACPQRCAALDGTDKIELSGACAP